MRFILLSISILFFSCSKNGRQISKLIDEKNILISSIHALNIKSDSLMNRIKNKNIDSTQAINTIKHLSVRKEYLTNKVSLVIRSLDSLMRQ